MRKCKRKNHLGSKNGNIHSNQSSDSELIKIKKLIVIYCDKNYVHF